MGAASSATVTLPDGRRLGFARLGAARGAPVLYFHGTPGSRLGLEHADGALGDAGIRLFALDRPGHGLSDRQPNRTMLDWPADVAAFADALDIETFAVVGWSGGGPYALACAHLLPERVVATGVVSGAEPPELTRWSAQSVFDQAVSPLSRRVPIAARAALRSSAEFTRRLPGLAMRSAAAEFSRHDRATIDNIYGRDTRAALAFFVEAFRQGAAGVAEDYRILTSPWGFALDDVAAAVTWWHGTDDRIVRIALARETAARLPHATLVELGGEGHLVPMNHIAEIAASLAGIADSADAARS